MSFAYSLAFQGHWSPAGLHWAPLVLVIELAKKPVFVIKSTGDLFPAAAAESCPLGHQSNLLLLSNLINVPAVFFFSLNTKHLVVFLFFFQENLILHTVQYLIKTRDLLLLFHVLKLIVTTDYAYPLFCATVAVCKVQRSHLRQFPAYNSYISLWHGAYGWSPRPCQPGSSE